MACLQPRIDAAGLQITSPGCLAGVFLSLAGRSNRVGSGGAPHDGTRQHDQVGWSGGGPHIVIRQYTSAILRATRAVASVRYHESPHDPSGAFM